MRSDRSIGKRSAPDTSGVARPSTGLGAPSPPPNTRTPLTRATVRASSALVRPDHGSGFQQSRAFVAPTATRRSSPPHEGITFASVCVGACSCRAWAPDRVIERETLKMNRRRSERYWAWSSHSRACHTSTCATAGDNGQRSPPSGEQSAAAMAQGRVIRSPVVGRCSYSRTTIGRRCPAATSRLGCRAICSSSRC